MIAKEQKSLKLPHYFLNHFFDFKQVLIAIKFKVASSPLILLQFVTGLEFCLTALIYIVAGEQRLTNLASYLEILNEARSVIFTD